MALTTILTLARLCGPGHWPTATGQSCGLRFAVIAQAKTENKNTICQTLGSAFIGQVLADTAVRLTVKEKKIGTEK